MKKEASLLLIKAMYPCFIKNASAYNVYIESCNSILNGKLPDQEKINNYKIGNEITKFATNLKNFRDRKEASNYAYMDKYYKYMPLHTKQLAKQSNDYFTKWYTNFKFEDRTSIAKKIFKKIGQESSNIVLFYANPKNLCKKYNMVKAAENILKRAQFASSHKDFYAVASKSLKSINTGNQLLKIAHLIEKMDRITGLYPYMEKLSIYNEKIMLKDPLSEILDTPLINKKSEEKLQVNNQALNPNGNFGLVEKIFLGKFLNEQNNV